MASDYGDQSYDHTTTYLYDQIKPELATALGALLINWNGAEMALRMLVTHFLGAHTTPVVSRLTNQNRISLLKASLEVAPITAEVKAAIENFVEVFDVCVETRNIIVHGSIQPRKAQGASVASQAHGAESE
jgi:hypothetical protein